MRDVGPRLFFSELFKDLLCSEVALGVAGVPSLEELRRYSMDVDGREAGPDEEMKGEIQNPHVAVCVESVKQDGGGGLLELGLGIKVRGIEGRETGMLTRTQAERWLEGLRNAAMSDAVWDAFVGTLVEERKEGWYVMAVRAGAGEMDITENGGMLVVSEVLEVHAFWSR